MGIEFLFIRKSPRHLFLNNVNIVNIKMVNLILYVFYHTHTNRLTGYKAALNRIKGTKISKFYGK